MNLKCQFKIKLNHLIILTHYFHSRGRLSFIFFILMDLVSTVTDDLFDTSSFKLNVRIPLADLIFLLTLGNT